MAEMVALMTSALIFSTFWTLAVACWLLKGWGHGLSIVNKKPMEIDTTRSDYFIVKLVGGNKWLYWLIRSAYMLPAIALMAAYYREWSILAVGLLIETQGLLYFIGGRISEKHGVRIGEFLTGGVIVVMMCLSSGIVK